MSDKWMIPCLYLYQGKAVAGRGPKERTCLSRDGDAVKLAGSYSDSGADGLLVFDLSSTDEEHEEAIGKIKEICQISQVPVSAAGNVKRVEDVKKLLYAGCQRVALNLSKESNAQMLKEVSDRFGREKIMVSVFDMDDLRSCQQKIGEYAGTVLAADAVREKIPERADLSDVPMLLYMDSDQKADALKVLSEGHIQGITGAFVSRMDFSLADFKEECRAQGIPVDLCESAIAWEELKLNGDGLIPVVVQDYQTDEVLMLAYMNEEAFETTLRTGKMTYWSRSRQELWMKGLTSGHFQYMKSLTLDCDNDTILAKVAQVGAACHTGNRACFFQKMVRKEYDDTNPLRVFQNVYQVIQDRKAHPKEGSYTNYLFDKGIDKILKKVGEECTEIVIAAKNPDKEEIKYEIADFLYHVMVLMAEKGVSWEDITRELARR